MLNFKQKYAEYCSLVKFDDSNTDLSLVATEIICKHQYPINALIGARYVVHRLRDRVYKAGRFDMILAMKATEANDAFFELVLRDENGFPYYGGWLVPAEHLTVSDEIICGYRVIVAHTRAGAVRHEFCPAERRYVPEREVCERISSVVMRRSVPV